jgi:4-diphosphocytidyl-2-C-methyl-D-erythritol kinase
MRAPAKINLYLEVLGRRKDGYHELESVLLPVRLSDSLSFTPTPPPSGGQPGTIEFRDVVGSVTPGSIAPREPLPPAAKNLVVHALELLRRRSGCTAGARVELAKRIPVAAGLGGGSSDAAAALKLGNRGWGIHWTNDRLAELAAELGSDVPFFLEPGAAICRGRGEHVERLPSIRPLDVVIVKPPAGLSTQDVYNEFDTMNVAGGPAANVVSPIGCNGLLDALRRGAIRELGRLMCNRLQAAAAALSPWIDHARTAFGRLDFLAHQLSGSGTAYFGICRHAQHARRLATILRTQQLGLICVTRSCC